jgi:hypothetical protein
MVLDSIRFSPVGSLTRFIICLATGRVRFPRHRLGRTISVKGTDYEIVKEIEIMQPGAGEPEVTFTVKFHLAGMSPAANKIFLNLPIPFFAGLPGFRHKLWLFDKSTGDFRGLYEWQTVEDARKYSKSFAVWFMKRRSVPGSVEYEIIEKSSGKTVEQGLP